MESKKPFQKKTNYNNNNNQGYQDQGYYQGGQGQYNQGSNEYYQDEEKHSQGNKGNKYGSNKPQGNKMFQDKPKASAMVPAKNKTIKLYTNQYRLSLGSDLSVYQYEIQVIPEDMPDTHILNLVYKSVGRKLEAILGLYVTAGKTVFTPTELNEDIIMETSVRSIDYVIKINSNTKVYFSGKKLMAAKMEDHNVIHNLINNILKQAFRDTDLRQIGRRANYFDMKQAEDMDGGSVIACPGFKATAFSYNSGMALVIDSLNKFLSKQTCLDVIYDIYDNNYKKDKEQAILKEFKYKTVVGNWGFKKTYIVLDVIFDETPVTYTFRNFKDQEMNIAEYFEKAYKMKITDKDQPLFLVKINDLTCRIPPEFCVIDGVPQSIREDGFKMRNLLSKCRKNPNQKFDAIESFAKDFFSQKALKKWDIKIESKPIEIETTILDQPQIQLKNDRTENGDEKTLKKLSIQKPKNLVSWVCAYDKVNYSNAAYVLKCMNDAKGLLGMEVAEPIWLELPNQTDFTSFEKQLAAIKAKSEVQIVLFVIGRESLYTKFKQACYKLKTVSQWIATKTLKKFSLTVASNVMKQMNSKMGGDLYNIKFSDKIKPNTMLMGLDVCHSGRESIVGFCASINDKLSQYYSDKIKQSKGQELVDKQLTLSIKNALKTYESKQKKLPEHFIVFRDGVGDAMRKQVIQKEIGQLKQAIEEVYNKTAKKPFITVIFVNKRISQRFFVEDSQGNLQNPPSGCLIDSNVVESESNQEFDFYLIPQNTTQGCALPTHFYVPYNDSPMDKQTIEKLTFDLCHYYFNWSGPIKVPAPCMYAHKIAELFNNLGNLVDTKTFDNKILESFHYL